jgi:hydrogen peroxide-dependent heme synthase
VSEHAYAFYPVFRATDAFRSLSGEEVAEAGHELEVLYKEWADRVTVRGTYSTVGFRPDADLMAWWVAPTPDDLQAMYAAFRRTAAGRHLQPSWTFLGVARPAEFSADHAPAFLKGEDPKRFLCVYPFVRTPEWYLLPPEQRGSLLREHGTLGREFPDILANTTSGFGLGDWEWILAFEGDTADRIVDCIRRLRSAEARLYTKEEIPFVTGIRKDVADVLRDLA